MQIGSASSLNLPQPQSGLAGSHPVSAGDGLQSKGDELQRQTAFTLQPEFAEPSAFTERAGLAGNSGAEEPLREKFQEFVGQTFFSELIKSLRTSQKGAAYFNGGRAEEIFQGQFDQMMTEHLSEASAQTIADPMFELFQLGRSQG
ncbi:MAG: rod-binding protein [Pirellulaceae bacterium]|nr:rod-binding protein [Pirellulaceae bacterium]